MGQSAGPGSVTRRDFVVAGGLGSVALASGFLSAVQSTPVHSSEPLDSLVPGRIGEWTFSPYRNVLIPRGEKLQDATYDDVLTRFYTSASAAPIILLIAYGSAQSGDRQLHRPEVCYPAAGFNVRNERNSSLTLAGVPIVARTLTAVARDRVEHILYWSRIGRDFPLDSLAQRWAILRQTVGGTVPDGVLVRISTLSRGRADAIARLHQFARLMVGAGGSELRSVLVGPDQ
jgi:EpsI family protein